jgi:hypothetical protein
MVNEHEQAYSTSQSSTGAGKPAVASDASDNVAQSQFSASQQSQSHSLTSLEKYCEENPSSSQCLIYDE